MGIGRGENSPSSFSCHFLAGEKKGRVGREGKEGGRGGGGKRRRKRGRVMRLYSRRFFCDFVPK